MRTIEMSAGVIEAEIPANVATPVASRSFFFEIDLRGMMPCSDDDDADIALAASRRGGESVPFEEVANRLNG